MVRRGLDDELPSMGTREVIGRNVRRLRLEKGMSQEALAHAMGNCSVTYLSRVERADADLSVDFLDRLAAALDVAADVLVTPSTAPADLSGQRAPRRPRDP